MMKLAGIFRDLEQLYEIMIFKQLAMVAILFFQNEAKILQRQVFIAINIPWKFDVDIFINEWDVKVYVKTWQTDGWTDGCTSRHVWKVFTICRPQPMLFMVCLYNLKP